MTDQTQQLRAEVTHWRLAADALADLEVVASPAAWAALEQYLHHRVRARLGEVVTALRTEARMVERMLEADAPTDEVRRALLRLRARYLRAETLIDFFGDAVNSRASTKLAELLRGYDIVASESMEAALAPLGIAGPPALVYHDKGLGASILRAGIRLWDRSHPSPVAAIKLTRHNLTFPTALLHESGHQVNALSGYNDELRHHLHAALTRRSERIADLVASWSSEIGADVHAFHQAGCAPVFALSNVVDGPSSHVFRVRLGDPHPPPYLRVLFNVELLRAWYRSGPWDDLAATWTERHPVAAAGSAQELTVEVLRALPSLVEICSRTPMRCFRGAAFGDVVDPRRVSPASLRAFELEAGGTLLTSTYLQRSQPVRVVALLTTRGVLEPARAMQHRDALVEWVRSLGRHGRTEQGTAA